VTVFTQSPKPVYVSYRFAAIYYLRSKLQRQSRSLTINPAAGANIDPPPLRLCNQYRPTVNNDQRCPNWFVQKYLPGGQNKKLSYRRETARQLPTWRGG